MFKKLSLLLSAMVICIGMFSITTPSAEAAKFHISFGSSYGGYWGARSYSRWGYRPYFTRSYAYYPWGRYNYYGGWGRTYGVGYGYSWSKGKGKKGRYLPTRHKKRHFSGKKAKRICFRNKRCRSAFYRYTRKKASRKSRRKSRYIPTRYKRKAKRRAR